MVGRMLRRDRWVMLGLTGAMVGWWALGLIVTDAASEPYPALMMPNFAGHAGWRGDPVERHRIVIEVELDDGTRRGRDAMALLEGLNKHVQRRAVDQAVRLESVDGVAGFVPPTAEGVAWLLGRVAAVERVEPGRIERMGAVLMLDELSIYSPQPRAKSTRVLEETLYERAGAGSGGGGGAGGRGDGGGP